MIRLFSLALSPHVGVRTRATASVFDTNWPSRLEHVAREPGTDLAPDSARVPAAVAVTSMAIPMTGGPSRGVYIQCVLA